MITLSISGLRSRISEITNRVMFGGERVLIKRNNKPVCAILSIEDVEVLEALEDKIDIEAAKEAIKQGNFIDLEGLMNELEL